MNGRTLVLAATAGLLILAACASPAVTGMKVHIQNGEYAEAVHLADSVIAMGEGVNAELWIWRGRAQGNLRDWPGAAESFSQAYTLDPAVAPELVDFWYVFYNTAAIQAADGNTVLATQMLLRGREIVPERPEFDMMLGDLALNQGDLLEALVRFETAWDLSEALIADLEAMLEETSDPSVTAWLLQTIDGAVVNGVLSLYNAGTISRSLAGSTEDEAEKQAYRDRAMNAFETALEQDPANSDILTAIAELYLLESNWEMALGIFDQAVLGVEQGLAEGWLTEEEAARMIGEIKLTRGFALIEMGEYTEAIAELTEALDLVGRDYSVLANIAHAFFQIEDYGSALGYLDQIISMEGITGEELGYTHYMRFACYIRMEEDATAATALETALQYDPENAEYWEYLASTYSRLGRRTDAINAMQKAEDIRNR